MIGGLLELLLQCHCLKTLQSFLEITNRGEDDDDDVKMNGFAVSENAESRKHRVCF